MTLQDLIEQLQSIPSDPTTPIEVVLWDHPDVYCADHFLRVEREGDVIVIEVETT